MTHWPIANPVVLNLSCSKLLWLSAIIYQLDNVKFAPLREFKSYTSQSLPACAISVEALWQNLHFELQSSCQLVLTFGIFQPLPSSGTGIPNDQWETLSFQLTNATGLSFSGCSWYKTTPSPLRLPSTCWAYGLLCKSQDLEISEAMFYILKHLSAWLIYLAPKGSCLSTHAIVCFFSPPCVEVVSQWMDDEGAVLD